ncbi:MAG: zinc/iron-chelating domain-containing protein [Desulfobacca sp.]|nr:zinc/iron-chelating domain-containing protein [Desulfobacca sp.]
MTTQETFNYLEGDSFSFACHPGVTCFTECCRDLNLVLTPYDLLRLKKALSLDSSDLLDQFTVIKANEHNGFPAVWLKMRDDERRTCPFVTTAGCRIYEDRPGACRIYPIGRASSRTKGQEGAREFYFVVRETHCQGFQEPRSWTTAAWSQDQGLSPYTFYNDLWTEIITHKGSLASTEAVAQKIQMFFMASYNLDQFRQFVFKSTFLKRFAIPEETVKRMEEDDEELLRLAFQWLKFVLFGEKVIPLKTD